MASNLVKLVLKIVNDPANKKTIGQAEKGFAGLAKMGRGLAAGAGLAIVGSQMTQLFSESTALAIEQRKQVSQLNAVIKSTGGAAGVSAAEVQAMASSLQKVTNFGDEATLSGQNLLLTFTNIGKDVFPSATKTMLDMSTAMGQDLKSSAVQIGKALNDPIQGITALSRVGVQFTEQQKEQIRVLTESGDVAAAQTLILAELNKEFGGSAEAARKADGGLTAYKNSVGDLKEALGELVLLPLAPLADGLRGVVEALTPKVQAGVEAWRGIADNVGYLGKVVKEAGLKATVFNVLGIKTADTQNKVHDAVVKVDTALSNSADSASADAVMLAAVARESQKAAVATANLAIAQRESARAAESARYAGLAGVYGAQTIQRDALERRSYLTNYFASLDEIQTGTTSAMSDMGNNLKSIIEGVIQPTLAEVWQPAGGEARMDENARRLATVATQGFGSAWLESLNAQYQGMDFWQPIADAMASGDSAALKGAAEKVLTGENLSQLWDKDVIIARVKEKLQEQNMAAEFAAAIAAELQGQGLDVSTADVSAQLGGGGQTAAGLVTGISENIPTAISDSNMGSIMYKSLTQSIKDNKEDKLAAARVFVQGLNAYLPTVINEFKFIDAIVNNVGETYGLSTPARP